MRKRAPSSVLLELLLESKWFVRSVCCTIRFQTFHLLNNWICWLLMISKWHSMEYIELLRVSRLVGDFLFVSHPPQNFRFNNSTQSKTTSFIDIKAMMWLSTASIKAQSPMPIRLPCIPLITNTVAMPLMKFWCCDHYAHHALNL